MKVSEFNGWDGRSWNDLLLSSLLLDFTREYLLEELFVLFLSSLGLGFVFSIIDAASSNKGDGGDRHDNWSSSGPFLLGSIIWSSSGPFPLGGIIWSSNGPFLLGGIIRIFGCFNCRSFPLFGDLYPFLCDLNFFFVFFLSLFVIFKVILGVLKFPVLSRLLLFIFRQLSIDQRVITFLLLFQPIIVSFLRFFDNLGLSINSLIKFFSFSL